MKSVTYWYQFFTAREELVPILHDVKFTKCEIYGSTMPTTLSNPLLFLLKKCENPTEKDSHIFPIKNNSVFVILTF